MVCVCHTCHTYHTETILDETVKYLTNLFKFAYLQLLFNWIFNGCMHTEWPRPPPTPRPRPSHTRRRSSRPRPRPPWSPETSLSSSSSSSWPHSHHSHCPRYRAPVPASLSWLMRLTVLLRRLRLLSPASLPRRWLSAADPPPSHWPPRPPTCTGVILLVCLVTGCLTPPVEAPGSGDALWTPGVWLYVDQAAHIDQGLVTHIPGVSLDIWDSRWFLLTKHMDTGQNTATDHSSPASHT